MGTLLHLAILRWLGASVIAELVSELLRAAIFVQIKASPAARPPGYLAPLEARLGYIVGGLEIHSGFLSLERAQMWCADDAPRCLPSPQMDIHR